MNVTDKTVLVTGANGGLGQALILALISAGATKVYAACRNPAARVDERPEVVRVALDVTCPQQVQAALRMCGDIDILINNAGANRQRRFLDPHASDAAVEEMAVNYFGTLSMCRAFAPLLSARRGAMVNVLSILARVTIPSMGSLCASKAAALRMTEGMRAELADAGVQVLAVLPGVIDTSMSRDFPGPKASPEAIAAAIVKGLDENAAILYPDSMAQQVAGRLDHERNAVVGEFARFL